MLNEQDRWANEEEITPIPKLMTAKEVGEMLGITERTVNKLAKDRRLGCVEITARERRFTMELVEEFIEAETNHRHPMWNETGEL